MSNGESKRTWQPKPQDNYREWLLKAIPSETIGVYLAANAAIQSMENPHWAIPMVLMILCAAATPMWLYYYGVKKWEQILVATIAVFIWTMTIPGSVWSSIPKWHPAFGTLAVVVYSGLIAPGIGFLATQLRK